MRKHTFLKTILAAVLLFFAGMGVSAQLLVEDFDYPSGALLVNNGWAAHSGAGTASIAVTAPGLEFAGYAGSGIGGAANVVNTGEDVNRTFPAQTAGTVYAAFIIRTEATNSAGYFFHFGQTTIGTIFFTRVWVNATGNGVGIGIGTSAPASYIPITAGTPVLLVAKLDIGTKISSLYVLDSFTATEPAAANQTFTETATFANVGSVALRQYHASQRVVVDGIRVATTWSEAVASSGPVTPSVAVPTMSPAAGVFITAQNITLSSSTEGATIRFTTNGDEPTETSAIYTSPISVSSTTTIRARAFKEGLTPSATTTAVYVFPTNVANIAAMRSAGPGVYRLTGEAVLTLQTTVRNAKYVQDATAAVLIDDAGGVITTTYNIGDGITGLVGTTAVINGMLQFTPLANPGTPSSTGNVVLPIDVALDQLVNFEAQLVRVRNVLINGTGNFVAGTSYNLNGGSNPILRTQYSDLNYIGQPIPSLMQDIIGVVLRFNTIHQLVPRSLAEFANSVVTGPLVIVRESAVPAFNSEVGNSDTKNITVSGVNLSGNISISLTGDNANLFSVTPQSISPTGGSVNDVTVAIRYEPTASGSHSATLTLTSPGASDVVRILSGTATLPPTQLTPPNVIITEVYGGGGNSGATLRNDFIELFNTTAQPVNIGGWSLQYYSNTGTGAATSANTFVFPAEAVIPPNSHFLVQAVAGAGGTDDLPRTDAVSTLQLAASAGKVLLYNVAVPQTISSDISSIVTNAAFVDYVPFGTTAVPVWGSAMGSNATNTNSATRRMIGDRYSYTQNIGFDFHVVAPTPTNSGATSVQNRRMMLDAIISNGTLRINTTAGQQIEVFNVLGQRVHTSVSKDGLNIIPLTQRGVVVVKVGNSIQKLTN